MITPGNVIGDIELPSPFLMAPLAGFTDNAVRTIALEFGAGLVYSEMVSAKGLIYEQKNTLLVEMIRISFQTLFQNSQKFSHSKQESKLSKP